MQPIRSLLMLVLLSVLATGCTTTMHYPMDSGMYQFKKKGTVKVLLNVVKDQREEVADKRDDVFYSVDAMFSEKIDEGVAQVIKAHLEESNTISSVDVGNVQLPLTAASKTKYIEEGYDFILSAKLKNFHGYQEGMIPIFIILGPLGVFLEMAINHKDVGGHTEYSDVKVIALSDKALSWRGSIDKKFDENVVWYSGNLEYAKSSLKDANNELAEVIDQLVIQDISASNEIDLSASHQDKVVQTQQ